VKRLIEDIGFSALDTGRLAFSDGRRPPCTDVPTALGPSTLHKGRRPSMMQEYTNVPATRVVAYPTPRASTSHAGFKAGQCSLLLLPHQAARHVRFEADSKYL
jgi:hypothetical protein